MDTEVRREVMAVMVEKEEILTAEAAEGEAGGEEG
jgi:hypothetical protein